MPPTPRSLARLERSIVACRKCPRLRAHCERIAIEKKRAYRDQVYWGKPVPGFGDPEARLFIVGLAPAAHGGNRTGRDDGVVLTDCFISASARCAPPANRPTRRELESCRPFLVAEMALLSRMEIVLTLGGIAHEAWLRAAGWWKEMPPRERPGFRHAGEWELPDGRMLVSAYHPSRQNTNTGRLTRAMWHAVFRRLRARLDGD